MLLLTLIYPFHWKIEIYVSLKYSFSDKNLKLGIFFYALSANFKFLRKMLIYLSDVHVLPIDI